jgi:hypothetical protein
MFHRWEVRVFIFQQKRRMLQQHALRQKEGVLDNGVVRKNRQHKR